MSWAYEIILKHKKSTVNNALSNKSHLNQTNLLQEGSFSSSSQ